MTETIHLEKILEILPHRYPFLLIDRVTDLSSEKCEAVKNVTYNENFFQGHFPSERVMPGVLILEAMAQCAAILALLKEDALKGSKGKVMYLLGFDSARIKRKVTPGDQLKLTATKDKSKAGIYFYNTKAYVGDELAAQAKVLASMS